MLFIYNSVFFNWASIQKMSGRWIFWDTEGGCHVDGWRKVEIEPEMQKTLQEKWDLAGITFPRNIETTAKLMFYMNKTVSLH